MANFKTEQIYQVSVGNEKANESSKEMLFASVDTMVEYFKEKVSTLEGTWKKDKKRGADVEFNKEEILKQLEDNGSAFFAFYGISSFWVNIYTVELIK